MGDVAARAKASLDEVVFRLKEREKEFEKKESVYGVFERADTTKTFELTGIIAQ